MLLASVTVRCPSNGHSASSTSGLLGPAAQSSAGRATCSCLSWSAVLPRRPHRPHTTLTASQAIPPLTHTPCYSAATATSHHSRTSEPSYSSPCGHPQPRLPRLRVIPFLGLSSNALVLSVRSGQHGQRPTSIGRVLYVERLTARSRRPQGSASLLRAK